MANLLPGESDGALALLDQADIVAGVLPTLHAATVADLVFWSECELIQWLDAALKTLARTAGLFIGRQENIVTSIGGATYALAAQHLSTIHASINGVPLAPSSTGELDAVDAAFLTSQGTTKRWYQDTLGLAAIGLAPIPNAVESLAVIYHGWPQTVDCAKTQTTFPLPLPLEPYVELSIVAEAYSKEGDAHAPDISSAARALMQLYEKAAIDLWGPCA